MQLLYCAHILKVKGIAYIKTAKSHVFCEMQINYPYIVGTMSQSFKKIVPEFFWALRQTMCIIVVSPK